MSVEMTETTEKGKLYVVSTHIGNRDDMTLRAIESLKRCDLVVCEEFKIGARILKELNLKKDLDTLNEQNEETKALDFLNEMIAGKKLALISDCGTPLIADPGYQLVRAALKAGIEIEVVPGVTSIMTAIVRSGFRADSFLYAGFLGRKPEDRIAQLISLSKVPRTVVLLETPYRLMPFLEAAAEVMPDRQAYIGVNLTMPFETHHYGTFAELLEKFNKEKIKAEFVVCFEGNLRPNSISEAINRFDNEELFDFVQDSDSPRPRRSGGDRNKNFGDRRSPRFDSGRRPKGFESKRRDNFWKDKNSEDSFDRNDRFESKRRDNFSKDRDSDSNFDRKDKFASKRREGFSNDRRSGSNFDRKDKFASKNWDNRDSRDRRDNRDNRDSRDNRDYRDRSRDSFRSNDRRSNNDSDFGYSDERRSFNDRSSNEGFDRKKKFNSSKPSRGGYGKPKRR